MTGGLLQLAAYGIENMYITDNPQITFFKLVYRRHTNFATESIPQFFNIQGDFSNRVSCILSKNGDLINKIYVVVILPIIPTLSNNCVVRWVDNIGYILLKRVEIEIGGKVIDTHYSDWLYIWNELNKINNQRGLDNMIGNIDELIKFENSKNSYRLYIPLQFWFCKNTSLSLPIIALENSEIKINIEFANLLDCVIVGPTHYIYIKDCICLFKKYELIQINSDNLYIQYINFNNTTMQLGFIKTDSTIILKPNDILTGIDSNYITSIYDPSSKLYLSLQINNEILNFTKSNTIFRNIFNLSLNDVFLYVDYIYLDNMERVKFINTEHEYLIDICQFDNDKIVYQSNNKIKVGYSHPVKEILIRAQFAYMINNYYKDFFNYTTSLNKNISRSLIKKMLIKLNGFNREIEFDKHFYTYVQSYQHHKSIAPLGLCLYSFSLYPFDSQPSGSCNFSKINDISIDITIEPITYNKPVNIRVYVISYNILKISNGVGRILFDK